MPLLAQKAMPSVRGSASRLPVPVEYGGKGQDLLTTAAAMEGLGYGCKDSGLIFALNAGLWTVTMPIVAFGTEEQKRRYLPGLCDGRLLGANAVSEPEAGSDIFGMRRTRTTSGANIHMNGRKTWITAGPIADLFLCFASTDPSKGILGISAFLVERDTPGFRVIRGDSQDGDADRPHGRTRLRGLRPAGESLLGREDVARTIFNDGLARTGTGSAPGIRPGNDAAAARTMHRPRADEKAIRPADRQVPVGLEPHRRYGRPAGDQPAHGLSIRMAEESGIGRPEPPSMAKLHTSECYLQNSLDAVRIFGAAGYVDENGLEARPPRQRRQRDLLGHERHPAQHHRPSVSPGLRGVVLQRNPRVPFDFGRIAVTSFPRSLEVTDSTAAATLPEADRSSPCCRGSSWP